MNQESNRRTTYTSTDNRHSPFFIRRYERAFAPEAKYVESACATLIENRFGLGRYMPVLVVLTDRPEPKPAKLHKPAREQGQYTQVGCIVLAHARAYTPEKLLGRISEPGAVATGFLNRKLSGTCRKWSLCGLSDLCVEKLSGTRLVSQYDTG